MKNKKKIKKYFDPGFKRFMTIAGPDLDPVLMVLRAHLLAEYYIDQLICLEIPRGDIILDKGFSFFQKLTILKSLDITKEKLVDCLEALNKLRNRCAHDMEYAISETDIDKIGLPQGKYYFEDKEKYPINKNRKTLLHLTLIGIIAPMDGLLIHVKKDHKGIGQKEHKHKLLHKGKRINKK